MTLLDEVVDDFALNLIKSAKLFNDRFSKAVDLGGNRDAVDRSVLLDMYELGDKYNIAMDAPGMTKDEIEIEVSNDDCSLVIAGERKTMIGVGKYIMQERVHQKFQREVRLPSDANLDSITASFDMGVLLITVAKKQQKQNARRIVIAS